MTISPAQLAANRANALKSCGPRTEEGKARSRANSLKHGLTGEGIVLPDEDAAEVDRRFAALEIELAPRSEMSLILVRRVAMLSVRMERSVEQEAANLSFRVRHAVEKFDDERLAEMEKAYDWIASEPLTNARRLRTSPEGIDRLLENFQSLRDRLADPLGALWDWTSTDRFHLLIGRRILDVPTTRARALGDAIGGNFQLLDPEDAPHLEGMDRMAWAVQRMVELIDVEIEALKTLRESLNPEAIEADRAEAPKRAKFDPSHEATLARKYEAATERGFFRTLRELKEARATENHHLIDLTEPVEDPPTPSPTPPEVEGPPAEETDPDPAPPSVGSSFAEAPLATKKPSRTVRARAKATSKRSKRTR